MDFTTPSSTLRKRRSSRLLVLDPTGRVLLFRFIHKSGPLAGQDFWATPGGALEPDESFASAAVRELREETGIEVLDPGPEVGRRECVFQLPDGEHVMADERYFVVRPNTRAVRRTAMTTEELAVIGDHRWWTLDELESTSDIVWPEDLTSLLRPLSVRG